MKILQAGMAEYQVSNEPAMLVALGLGSCVGVCMYDSSAKVGGLLHVMLPDSKLAREGNPPAKFADTGVPLLFNKMRAAGANPIHTVVKIAGGAQMFKVTSSSMNIGARNVEAVKEALKQLRLRISAEDTGGTKGRTVKLDNSTGRITVKTIGTGEKEL